MAHADSHLDTHHGHHIIPKRLLLIVFGALVFLTIFTVLSSRLDLGAFNVPLALAIALTKAGLVLTFFMALKFDNRVNTLVFAVGAIFVVVFLVFTLFDTAFRGDIGNMSLETISDLQRQEEALMSSMDGSDAGEVQAAGLIESNEDPDLVARGLELYQQLACVGCHSTDGTQVVGPSFNGLFGQQRTFADGTTTAADEAYIGQAIREPAARVVEGFQPLMPPFATLSDDDVAALTAFIKSQR